LRTLSPLVLPSLLYSLSKLGVYSLPSKKYDTNVPVLFRCRFLSLLSTGISPFVWQAQAFPLPMPGSKTRTKNRLLFNAQRLEFRRSETSVDLLNQKRAAGLFVLVRIRLFVWLSVVEFLQDSQSDIPIPEEEWETKTPDEVFLERIFRKGLSWSSSNTLGTASLSWSSLEHS
jgi:hypothetical protein